MSWAERSCERCLRRSWLIARLASHLDRVRDRTVELLELEPEELIDAVGGGHSAEVRHELDRFDPAAARAHIAELGLEPLCACDPHYPPRLRALHHPPSVLYVAGGLNRFLEVVSGQPVAVVGARRASSYGLDMARSLGRGLASAGLTVISGMALGVDSAAHSGALEACGRTVAVLPGGPERPYPASRRALHRQVCDSGCAISELPPGTAVWRWMFPARNRVIAALAAMTIVVEAAERSGALLTAASADALGRCVGAVPGRVTSPLATGPNRLLAGGARFVRGPQDVLDHLFGAGARIVGSDRRGTLDPSLREVLSTIASGVDTVEALNQRGLRAAEVLSAVAELELAGYVRRTPGGRFAVVP